MEFSAGGGAVAWTGGIKELLDSSQRRQKLGDTISCHPIDELEPTSVLDIGSRFSPPLECTCSQYTGLDMSRPESHPNPSCPHAQECWDGYTHPLAEQLMPGTSGVTDVPSHWKRLEDPYLHLSTPGFNQWGEAECMLQDNDLTLWADQDQELLLLPYLENNGPYTYYGSADSAYSASFYHNGYPQNYVGGIMHGEYMDMEEQEMHMPPSGYDSNLMCSLEEDDLVNIYINHTGEISCEELMPTSDRSQPLGRCQSLSSFDSERSSCFTEDEVEPHLPRMGSSNTMDFQQDHTPLHIYGMDDLHRKDMKSPFIQLPSRDIRAELPSMIPNELPSTMIAHAQTGTASSGSLQNSDQLIAEREPALEPDGIHAETDNNIQHNGLQLVHLLLAGAEAVAWRDLPLAASLLQQLNMFASYSGDSIQRVTYCFAEGLSARLATMSKETLILSPEIFTMPTRAEKREGLLQLYQCSPYISFGFFAANQAILQAFEKKKQVHILDLGMMQNLQWPGLIRALATRPEGPPHVRITAIGAGLETLMGMNEWGRELVEFASSLKVPLEFRALAEAMETTMLTPMVLGIREGETLAINSVLQLHRVVKESRGSLKGVLQGLHRLGPAVMTLVEQDASHNGPFFLGRFLESLHYYSAIFDSLEASLPRHSQQRLKVERLYFAEEIRNIVACEGLQRVERHERADQWKRQMSRAGFQAVPLKFISQARMLLSLYSCDGYTLSEEKGCLILGWKGKPIMLASAWKSSCSSP